MIGAILVQNTAWRNVERSVHQLKEQNLLRPETLIQVRPEVLEGVIRPSDFMRSKGSACTALARWTVARRALNGGVENTTDTTLRTDLLSLIGVGPETADVIMLYAFNRPTFIWDSYARRLLTSYGQAVPSSYEAARRRFNVKVKQANFSTGEFHALIVAAGRQGVPALFFCSCSPSCLKTGVYPP